jgi:arylsulfatase B
MSLNSKTLFVSSLLLFGFGCKEDSIPMNPESDPPNILVIIADDMGWDAFGNYPGTNGVKAKTPVIDSLAQVGVTFYNFWVNPTCSPTRANLLTGKYSFRTAIGSALGGNSVGLKSSEILLQQYIANQSPNNYALALIGKWHLGSSVGLTAPEQFGIGYFSGIFQGTVADYYNWTRTSNGIQTQVTNYATSYFVDQSISWIQKQDQPWFLWLAFNAPHTPFHLPPIGLISNKSLPVDQASINSNRLIYYLAAIEAMDTEIGRLFSSFTEEERRKTIVIFLGDNGTGVQVAQLPYSSTKSKESLFQGGINVPLIISGASNSRKNEIDLSLVNGTDLYATIAAFSGVEVSAINDSYSLIPLLKGEGSFPRKIAYSEQFGSDLPSEGWAIRNQRYKLIQLNNGVSYLFDLISDPFENIDLLAKPLTTEELQAVQELRLEKEKLN